MLRILYSAALIAAVTVLPLSVQHANAADTTVRVGNLEIAPFLPVAYAAKLASAHDLDVKVVNFRRGLETANALKAGEVDIAVGGIEAALSAIGGGTPAVIVASCSTGGVAWVSAKDSPIEKIEDLKGKSFGVIRGLHELFMRVAFQEHGMTVSDEAGSDGVHVVFINSPPSLLVALKSGDVDAVSAPEPFPSRAISEGYAKLLLRPYDTELRDVPRAVFMRKQFIEEHPEEAQKFVDALVDATRQLRDDQKLAKTFALEEAFKGLMTEEDWELSAQNMTFNVSLDKEEIGSYIKYMMEYGMLQSEITADQVTDLDMLEKAKSTQGW